MQRYAVRPSKPEIRELHEFTEAQSLRKWRPTFSVEGAARALKVLGRITRGCAPCRLALVGRAVQGLQSTEEAKDAIGLFLSSDGR